MGRIAYLNFLINLCRPLESSHKCVTIPFGVSDLSLRLFINFIWILTLLDVKVLCSGEDGSLRRERLRLIDGRYIGVGWIYRVQGMGWADGPFHREPGVKGKGSREWMIATTISVSDWRHNRRESMHLTSASVFKTHNKHNRRSGC
jgi:hypothetical protein